MEQKVLYSLVANGPWCSQRSALQQLAESNRRARFWITMEYLAQPIVRFIVKIAARDRLSGDPVFLFSYPVFLSFPMLLS
jgi:hypothetical protein